MTQACAGPRLAAPKRGRGARLSFVRILHDQRPGRESLRGLFHLLTGECIELEAGVLSRLMAGDGGADLRHLRDALCERWHLTDCTDFSSAGEDPLAPWRNHFMTVPVHTPCLTIPGADATTVYRPEGLARCRLPRDARIPRVIRERLDPECGRLLRRAARRARLGDALDQVGLDSDAAAALISVLTHPDRQMIRLVASRRQIDDPCAQHQYPMQSFVRGGKRVAAGRHYEDCALDSQLNFDWLEPTVAHSFRFASTALGGRAYGAALFDAIQPLAVSRRDRPRILEVGGGTGDLALSFLDAARQATGRRDALDYHILDRAPKLLAAQRRLLDGHGFNIVQHRADAQRARPPGVGFDHVLANEVIADFEVDTGPDGNPRQVGAMAFIRLLAGILVPGGRAYVSEYGSLASPAQRVEHLAHDEYAVDFGHLRRFATSIGLRARARPLSSLLEVREDTPMLIGQQEHTLCLKALFADHDLQFDACAYDRDRFEALYGDVCSRLELIGPAFAPLSAGLHFGPALNQFLVLILDRPDSFGFSAGREQENGD